MKWKRKNTLNQQLSPFSTCDLAVVVWHTLLAYADADVCILEPNTSAYNAMYTQNKEKSFYKFYDTDWLCCCVFICCSRSLTRFEMFLLLLNTHVSASVYGHFEMIVCARESACNTMMHNNVSSFINYYIWINFFAFCLHTRLQFSFRDKLDTLAEAAMKTTTIWLNFASYFIGLIVQRGDFRIYHVILNFQGRFERL